MIFNDVYDVGEDGRVIRPATDLVIDPDADRRLAAERAARAERLDRRLEGSAPTRPPEVRPLTDEEIAFVEASHPDVGIIIHQIRGGD